MQNTSSLKKNEGTQITVFLLQCIFRCAVEATLQDTYSSILVSNKASTESAAAVQTTELVDNDLYVS